MGGISKVLVHNGCILPFTQRQTHPASAALSMVFKKLNEIVMQKAIKRVLIDDIPFLESTSTMLTFIVEIM
jgi:hypothetical protein